MIENKAINEILHSTISERVQIIEMIFQSLKGDFEKERENAVGQSQPKPFKVRKFHLGHDIHVDRDELYAERT